MKEVEETEEGFYSFSSQDSRELSEDDLQKLAKQTIVTDFKRNKLEIEARKNWDKFYHRNRENFFKDRHWSAEDLKIICPDIDFEQEIKYLEAGCGVGNMMFPLVAELPNLKLFAFDFSENAVKLLAERASELGLKVATSVVDLSIPSISSPFEEKVDLATLIFVLSAIHPDKHKVAAENMRNLVKIGGTIVVRDYGVNDHAMIRFGRDARLGDRFYVRQDGTRAFYFELEELSEMFEAVGFKCVSKEYLHRITINHKKNLKVPRIFVQARFVRES
uniref:tRNA N(3)-methylcytidine methyltransferase n=1 Tax=Caenorhabditis japonica TaxID=281687 RepID=A0A8R1DIS3_CAEJA